MNGTDEDWLRRACAWLQTTQGPPDLVAPLLAGLLLYHHLEGTRPLCSCIGLRRPGKRSMRTRDRQRRRDAAIREALRQVAIGETISAWERCHRLADELRAWPCRWRTHQMRGNDFPQLNKLDQALYRIASYNGPKALPTTARHLYAILLK